MVTPNFHNPFNIMLAVDGSEHSLAATKLLYDLPLTDKSFIYAVTVLIPSHASDYHGMLKAVLRQVDNFFQDKNIQVKTELLVGYPGEMLTQYAEQHRPELIVLGAKGLRATLGILLGGVAQQIVEYACCPVLVVRAPYKGVRQVLIVTDGSRYSQSAVEYLANFPLPERAKVHLVHVLPPLPSAATLAYAWPLDAELFTPSSPYESEEALAQQAQEEERNGRTLLKRTEETLNSFGIKATRVLKRGDAATEILEFAKSNQIDLIIAGSRGLSRVQSWLLGSVSRKLVHYAQCSVMIVKGV